MSMSMNHMSHNPCNNTVNVLTYGTHISQMTMSLTSTHWQWIPVRLYTHKRVYRASCLLLVTVVIILMNTMTAIILSTISMCKYTIY